jgi:hypothetical protein
MRKAIIVLFFLFGSYCFGQTIVKGLYVDKFAQILGNIQKEDSLLNYAVNKGFNYLALYDLWTIHTTSSLTNTTTALPLANFLNKARTTFSISNIGATGENYWFFSNVIHIYNQQHSNPDHKLNVYNLEFEFWTASFVNTGGIYCTSYLQPAGYSCDTSGGFKFYVRELRRIDSLGNTAGITSETYIGWPNSGQAKAIVRNCDRVLVHAYVSNESTTYNYTRNRLIDLSGATTTAKIMPIFSAEPVFMGPWIQTNTPLQAYTNYNANFIAETGTWKSNVSVLGYQWFAYSYMPNSLTTSVKELKQGNTLEAMPNPSNGILNIKTDFNSRLKLIDSFGKEVMNFIIEKNKAVQINTSELPNAIYYLIVPESSYAKKIVVLNQ